MKSMPITMREVAAQCGVSQATVSLSLNNSPLIPETTKARVLEMAARMKYRIHPLIAAHMRSRRRPQGVSGPVLALVNTQQNRDWWKNVDSIVLKQMVAGAIDRAKARGYIIAHFWLFEEGMSQARLCEILRARGITGALFGPSGRKELDLGLDWRQFACVKLGSSRVSPALHRVMNDQYQSAILALNECHKLGYRRPGFICENALAIAHDRRWEAGFLVACEHLPGIRRVPSLLLETAGTNEAVLRWYRRYRPDVIVDVAEFMAYRFLREAKIRIPEDVGVVTLSAATLGSVVSGTVQDGYRIGTNSIDLLISLVEQNATGWTEVPIIQITSSSWNLGRTLRSQPVLKAGRLRRSVSAGSSH